jgi:RsiW-degrading membrane proteinase PrsW (M82 family)
MTWRRYLQTRTRNPAFLWRMVIGILLTGVVVGLAVDATVPAWIHPKAALASDDSSPEPDSEPDPEQLVPDWGHLEQLADGGEWRGLWGAVPRAVVRSWRHPGATGLALLTGACWTAFALQSIQPPGPRGGRFWLPLVALACGVLSIWPTVFLIFWQERQWGLVESTELTAGLRFFILGVGLREELAKFCCFLPLLPWCVRRRDELAALIVAGCVGIGFATEENVNYIWGSVGSATLTRLLTPAPFHMAITGLLGLAAYRACVWPKEWGPIFVATFGVAVLAHGLYDSFFSLAALTQYSLVSMLIFIGLIYQFFRELRPLQALRMEPVSLTANFLFCVATVAAATFVYLCAAVGWQPAADVLVSGIVGEAAMVYLFLREMPETMVTV